MGPVLLIAGMGDVGFRHLVARKLGFDPASVKDQNAVGYGFKLFEFRCGTDH
jgi:hypothetical protein